MVSFFILALLGYVLGSASSAVLVCRYLGLPDPRTQGSGNPGTNNVLRFGGKQVAAIVFFCDALKPVLVVSIAKMLGVSLALQGCIVLCTVLGQMFPIFFEFKGGKGVATAFGGLFALAWPIAILCAVIWIVLAMTFHYASLASMVAVSVSPLLCLWWGDFQLVPLLLLLASLIVWRHHSNIQRLLSGSESRMQMSVKEVTE